MSNLLYSNATVKLLVFLNDPSQKRASKGHGSLSSAKILQIIKLPKIKSHVNYKLNY